MSPAVEHAQAGRLAANNIVPKPAIPGLALPRQEAGTIGHAPGTSRLPPAPGTGAGTGGQQHPSRGAMTSRPALAPSAPAAASTTGVASGTGARAAPAAPPAETGPITPAQAVKRYGDYLTPFEQSEILQYGQARCQIVAKHWHVCMPRTLLE